MSCSHALEVCLHKPLGMTATEAHSYFAYCTMYLRSTATCCVSNTTAETLSPMCSWQRCARQLLHRLTWRMRACSCHKLSDRVHNTATRLANDIAAGHGRMLRPGVHSPVRGVLEQDIRAAVAGRLQVDEGADAVCPLAAGRKAVRGLEHAVHWQRSSMWTRVSTNVATVSPCTEADALTAA